MENFKVGDKVIFFDARPDIEDKMLIDEWRAIGWRKEFKRHFGNVVTVVGDYDCYLNSYEVEFASGDIWHLHESYLKATEIEPDLSKYQLLFEGVWTTLTEEHLLNLYGVRLAPEYMDYEAYRWVIKGTDADPEEIWVTSSFYIDEEDVMNELRQDVNILTRLDATRRIFKRQK